MEIKELEAFSGRYNEVERREPLTFEPHRRRGAAIKYTGAVLLSAVAVWGLSYEKSGQLDTYDPKIEVAPNIDGVHTVLDWNMHNETAELLPEVNELIEKYNPDIFAMQEVNRRDAKKLHDYFPDWYVNFDMADVKMHALQGGYGNVLMSRQELIDIEDKVIGGNSLLEQGLRTAKGVARASTKEVSDATQENRVIFGGVTEVATSEGLTKVRTITLHLSGDPQTHQRHLDEAVDFIVDQKEKGVVTIVIGDFNDSYNDVAQTLTAEGFMVARTDPTTKDKIPVTADYYAQEAHPKSPLFMAAVKVVPTTGSDHQAVLAVAHAK